MVITNVEITITGDDSILKIKGIESRLVISKEIKGVVVHFDTFPGNRLDQKAYVHDRFTAEGFHCLSFHYPGTQGDKNPFDFHIAAEGAILVLDYVRRWFKDVPVYIFGESFGALGALVAIEKFGESMDIKAISFRAPVPDIDMLCKVYGEPLKKYFRKLWIAGVINGDPGEYASAEAIEEYHVERLLEKNSKYNIPMFVICGEIDSVMSKTLIMMSYKKYAYLDIYETIPHQQLSDEQWDIVFTKTLDFFTNPTTEKNFAD